MGSGYRWALSECTDAINNYKQSHPIDGHTHLLCIFLFIAVPIDIASPYAATPNGREKGNLVRGEMEGERCQERGRGGRGERSIKGQKHAPHLNSPHLLDLKSAFGDPFYYSLRHYSLRDKAVHLMV